MEKSADIPQFEEKRHNAEKAIRDHLRKIVHTLEDRDIKFMSLYLSNGMRSNAAARQLGLSPAMGTYIRKKPAVAEVLDHFAEGMIGNISQALARLQLMSEADITDVLKRENGRYVVDLEEAKAAGVSQTVRRYKSSQRTYKDKDGAEVTETNEDVEISDPLKAFDMINKMTGRYQRKRGNDNDGQVLDWLSENQPELLPLIFEKGKSPTDVLIQHVLGAQGGKK